MRTAIPSILRGCPRDQGLSGGVDICSWIIVQIDRAITPSIVLMPVARSSRATTFPGPSIDETPRISQPGSVEMSLL
jgi:hypothetical protein